MTFGHLQDSDMVRYDHISKIYHKVDWSRKDKQISVIRQSLLQKAGKYSPETGHIIPEFTPISNQGPINSCVANAWCDMLEILNGVIGEKVSQLSRLFLYWTSRYYTGGTDKDGGTYLRSAATQLRNIGIVDEKWWPYSGSVDVVFQSPDLDLYTMASNNRISGFYKQNPLAVNMLSELELAIFASHPFVFGVDISRDFENYNGGGEIFSAQNADIVGSHAMICVGVGYNGSERFWVLRNSWGVDWGDSGHVKVNDLFISQISDIWIGTTMLELL